MTDFHPFPVSSIRYVKSDRQRQKIEGISDLADSIRRVGLLNPIIVDRDGTLIAGERRYLAVSSLGWDQVIVQFRDELTDEERLLIEYEENAKRLDLTWQENTLAIARFHQLKKALAPADQPYTAENLATDIGLVERAANRYLRVARALQEGDPTVSAATGFSIAYGILERKDARKKDGELASIQLVGSGKVPASVFVSAEPEPEEAGPPPIPLIQADFTQWARDYTGPKFNFLHCDFPYGIDAGDHDQGAAQSFGGYEDSTDTYFNLLDVLAKGGQQFLAESAHLIFWFSPKFYQDTMSGLQIGGWTVNPYPLIWHRSDNSGIIPDPRRSPRQVYETAFLCSRGDRFLVRPRSNLFASPNVKQYHMSEKPLPVLEHFMSMVVDEHSVVLDPTAGSGNSLITAHRLGAKEGNILGLEISPDFVAVATDNWRKNYAG